MADVDDRIDIELNNALDATVQWVSIEFLRKREAAKPHVVFNFTCLNHLELLRTETQQSKGCRVSMDWTGENADFEGELLIKPRPYMESSYLATGALSFPVIYQPSITLREVIDIFRGRHPLNGSMATLLDENGNALLDEYGNALVDFHHVADLTRFAFVQPDPRNSALDGCRDFMYVLPTLHHSYPTPRHP